MIKRILILCTLLLISAYLVLAVTAFNGKPDNRICKGMELVVKDSVNFGFVTPAEVKALLKAKKLSPEGKPLNSINVRRLEETLDKPVSDESGEGGRDTFGQGIVGQMAG